MIFLILILGLILRFVSLNQSLWLDEATSILTARDLTFSDILTKFSPGDFHPPLYYLMLKVWMMMLGSSEVAARSLSVVLGISTIYIVFLIGKKLFNKNIGLVSALFLATAPLHLYYSQEARMYSMETLLATIVVYFVITKKFLWLTIFSAALLYTDYLPVFLLASLVVYLIIYEKKYIVYVFGWIIATGVIFLPWIPTLLTQIQSGVGVRQNAPLWWQTLGRTDLKELALVPVKFIIGRISSYNKIFYGSIVAVAAVPFFITLIESLSQFSKTKLLWWWLAGPLILSSLFGTIFSGFSYFRLIFILPAFYLLVAYGGISINQKVLKLIVIGGILIVNIIASSIYLFNPRFHREDWRKAVIWIEENARQKTAATLFIGNGQREAYHYYAKFVPDVKIEDISKNKFNVIYLMRYAQPIFDPQDEVRYKLENIGFEKTVEWDFNGVGVWKYENRY
ncbi:glycosyltransferase family 39 protein [Candidatus Microgenomates bacterium]|nr:glycosyltransferase family 39 protein [Candidatus Microgenomates bacterium]